MSIKKNRNIRRARDRALDKRDIESHLRKMRSQGHASYEDLLQS